MKLPSSFTTLVAAMAALLPACDSGDAASPMRAKDFPTALFVAHCDSFARCPETVHAIYPSNIARALSSACADVVERDPELEGLIERGRVTLDRQAAERCLTATRACHLAEPACELALRGTVASDDSCVRNEECRSGWCDGGFEGCGVCAPEQTLAEGERCGSSLECAQREGEPSYCVASEPGEERRCTRVDGASEGTSCLVSSAACAEGRFCAADGSCRATVPVGAPCSSADRCDYGALCTSAVDGDDDNRRCIAVEVSSEACTIDFEVSSAGTFAVCNARYGLTCDEESKTCVRTERVGEGARCGGRARCADGLFCNEETRCTKPRELNGPCRSAFDCQSNRCSEGRCADLTLAACD